MTPRQNIEVLSNLITEPYMKDNGNKIRETVKVGKFGEMEVSMRVIG